MRKKPPRKAAFLRLFGGFLLQPGKGLGIGLFAFAAEIPPQVFERGDEGVRLLLRQIVQHGLSHTAVEPLVGTGDNPAAVGELDPHQAAIRRLAHPFDQPLGLQAVDPNGHGADRHTGGGGQLRHRARIAAANGVQRVHLGDGHTAARGAAQGLLLNPENFIEGFNKQAVEHFQILFHAVKRPFLFLSPARWRRWRRRAGRTARPWRSAPHGCQPHVSPPVDVGDVVGVPDGGQPVRNDKGGSALRQLVEGGLNVRLGNGVEGEGRLVDYFMDYLPLPQNRLFLVYTLLCLLSPTSQQKVKALDKKRMARVRAMRF